MTRAVVLKVWGAPAMDGWVRGEQQNPVATAFKCVNSGWRPAF